MPKVKRARTRLHVQAAGVKPAQPSADDVFAAKLAANPKAGFKQILSKKAKMNAKRKKFRMQLLLPGDASKTAKEAAGSSFKTESLTDTLSEITAEIVLEASTTAGDGKKKQNMSKAARKARDTQEKKQFTAILAHPAFQANPLETLREHLRNKQAYQDAEQARLEQEHGVSTRKKRGNINGSKKKKTRKKKNKNKGGAMMQ